VLAIMTILMTSGLAAFTGDSGVAEAATIQVKSSTLTDHECNSSEWHFVITQLTSDSQAPASIRVTFSNGQTISVPLEKVTGKTAHYTTTRFLNLTVVSATAEITGAWSGQFNLSHGPCPTPTPTPTNTPTKTPTPKVIPTGVLKVCKALAEGTTAPAGTLFTFSVTGLGTVSVAPGTCTLLQAVPAGSATITETGPSTFVVSDIVFVAGSGTANVAGGSAVATVAAGQTTEVLFVNRAVPTPTNTPTNTPTPRVLTTAYIQICKVTEPNSPAGTFSFTSPGFAGTETIQVRANATQPVCSGAPIQVQLVNGQTTITEAVPTNWTLVGVTVSGQGTATLSGNTVTLTNPGTSPSTQTQVIFRNRLGGVVG
jgi:hypothetical protein